MSETVLHHFGHDPRFWEEWQPVDQANLCFIFQGPEVLLIRKKRGLGAGKLNGPGGKLEPGETFQGSAIRETREEIGVTPTAPAAKGELYFDFVDGYRLYCAVFRADGFEGTPISTPEADPIWHATDSIPYDEMWSDDRFWLPLLVENRCFRGYFRFDGEKMLTHHVAELACGALKIT